MYFEDIQSGFGTLVRFRYGVLCPLVLVEKGCVLGDPLSVPPRKPYCYHYPFFSEERIGSPFCDDPPWDGARMEY